MGPSTIITGIVCLIIGYKLGYAIREDEAKKQELERERLEEIQKQATKDALTKFRTENKNKEKEK
tara:strand:- start:5220 stop:5414 length:195 start_codon:yes stop_codon:yes gene_type:complete